MIELNGKSLSIIAMVLAFAFGICAWIATQPTKPKTAVYQKVPLKSVKSHNIVPVRGHGYVVNPIPEVKPKVEPVNEDSKYKGVKPQPNEIEELKRRIAQLEGSESNRQDEEYNRPKRIRAYFRQQEEGRRARADAAFGGSEVGGTIIKLSK